MLKFISSGLYRKFLVLAVLSVSLFVLSSANRASAIPCCAPFFTACDNAYTSCVSGCHLYIGIPTKYALCLDNCDKAKLACYANIPACDPNPGCIP